MATPTIKSTYSLDVESVRALDDLARRWQVSKSEALRRAIRRAEQRGADAKTAKTLKGSRYCLLKHPKRLKRGEKRRLAAVRRANRALDRAYELKEYLATILEQATPDDAGELLDQWLTGRRGPAWAPFVKLARTIRKHAVGILAHLDTKMTNGLETRRNGSRSPSVSIRTCRHSTRSTPTCAAATAPNASATGCCRSRSTWWSSASLHRGTERPDPTPASDGPARTTSVKTHLSLIGSNGRTPGRQRGDRSAQAGSPSRSRLRACAASGSS